MKVIITGGGGFLGSELAEALLARGELTGASGNTEPIEELVLLDARFGVGPTVAPARRMEGDITEQAVIEEAIGVEVKEFYENRDGLAVVANEEIVTNLSPSMDKISKMDYIGLIVTSRGENVDFVSRFFAPQIGVPEDPVTGSAHCELIPLWAEKLNKNKIHSFLLF